MFSGPGEQHAAGRCAVPNGHVIEADVASARVFVPQPVKVAMQGTVKIVGLPPTQEAMGPRAGAAIVTHPLERNRAALYQIRRGIGIGARDDVDGITDETRIGLTYFQ